MTTTVDEKIFCSECGCLIYGDVYEGTHGRIYCEDCADHMETCNCCGVCLNTDDHMTEVYSSDGDSSFYCEDCFANSTATYCECCGEYFEEDVPMTYVESERGYVCDDCLDEHFTACERCGDMIRCDDAYSFRGNWYCESCYDEISNPQTQIIYGYHDYPMDWEFRGKDDELHFGVELEIENGGEYDDHAIAITSALGFPCDESDELICSHDGSLHDGFEIITQPSTYDYLVNSINWEAGLAEARRLGYRSHNGGNCGLHVHMDTGYFDNLYPTRNDLENNVAALLLNNSAWLKPFCRRERWGYCEFPEKIDWDLSQNEVRRTFRRIGRYAAANFLPYNTIEFRFMRGTLIPSTFKAALQLMSLIGKALAIHKSLKSIESVNVAWFLQAAEQLGYVEFTKEYFNRCKKAAMVEESF